LLPALLLLAALQSVPAAAVFIAAVPSPAAVTAAGVGDTGLLEVTPVPAHAVHVAEVAPVTAGSCCAVAVPLCKAVTAAGTGREMP
jgi:hypothetical protein